MAVQLVKERDAYASAFSAFLAAGGTDEPAWLRRVRERAFEHFERVGFPTVAEEEWKYTNVARISKAMFALLPAGTGRRPSPANDLVEFVYDEARGSRLVFMNGTYQPDLSSVAGLPADVVAVEIGQALGSSAHEPTIQEHLGRYVGSQENGFTALNTALFSSGVLLRIPSGVRVESPIHLLFVSQDSNGAGAFAAFPRVLVIAEEGSEATLIESYASANGGVYFNDVVVEIVLGDNAHLRHYKIQRESLRAFHVATTKANLGRNSSYDTKTINLGAALSRHDLGVTMDHEGAECWVDGLYMIDGDQHADTHSVIDHRQPRCTSHQLYKGILDGKSHAVFNGKVFVRHDAQQTDAQQTNKNLLLSNDARVDTKPQLEIFADDVKCAHGAAIGQLQEDELFYLESRGINPKLARNLLTYGFAKEVIERIGIESIKRELDEAVLNRLHVDLEVPKTTDGNYLR
jgi:Fe-S cluster assembly protein SufD